MLAAERSELEPTLMSDFGDQHSNAVGYQVVSVVNEIYAELAKKAELA